MPTRFPAQKPGRKARGFHYISIWVIRLDNKLTRLRKAGNESSALRRLKRITDRMYNLSAFMQSLKQAMCEWFNRTYRRIGPVWTGRFTNVLVEGSLRELLHCRVRYFTDSLAIGTRAFVEGVFAGNRSHFGPHRKEGARPLRPGRALPGLVTLRALRRSPVS